MSARIERLPGRLVEASGDVAANLFGVRPATLGLERQEVAVPFPKRGSVFDNTQNGSGESETLPAKKTATPWKRFDRFGVPIKSFFDETPRGQRLRRNGWASEEEYDYAMMTRKNPKLAELFADMQRGILTEREFIEASKGLENVRNRD